MELCHNVFVVSVEVALIAILWCIVDYILDGALFQSLNNFIHDWKRRIDDGRE